MNTDTTKIKIVQITGIQQLKQCTAMFAESYKGEPWNDSWTDETAQAILNCYFNAPAFMGWVATADGNVVGCCIGNIEPYYNGNNFILKELFVAVGSQKKGIGQKLLEAMKNDVTTSGVKQIFLFTRKVIADFYVKSGFAEMEEMCTMLYKIP
jgi:aminoglycoside 6'-N-acetyltransferase I